MDEFSSVDWSSKSAFGRLGEVFKGISEIAAQLANLVNRASISNVFGATDETNVSGEVVQKLDRIATDIIVENLLKTGCVTAVSCEEEAEPIFSDEEPSSEEKYVISTDPIDGSSNIDVAVSIGSIFGIWRSDTDSPVTNSSILHPGNKQIGAAYVIYGSSTILITATRGDVNGFTLDPTTGRFVHTHHNIRIPEKCPYYSVNEGNAKNWDSSVQKALVNLRSSYSLRYIGSLVADFHRNLLKGGVFLYPADQKNTEGKLRLMYEANPLGFIAEQAGGAASNGLSPILEIQPESLHQRTSLFVGNANVIDKLTKEAFG